MKPSSKVAPGLLDIQIQIHPWYRGRMQAWQLEGPMLESYLSNKLSVEKIHCQVIIHSHEQMW